MCEQKDQSQRLRPDLEHGARNRRHSGRRRSDDHARCPVREGLNHPPRGEHPNLCTAWRRKGIFMSIRPVKQIMQTTPTLEGAGVKLQRAFGFGKTKDFDPFLLLDDFRNENPADYLAGFPWHPHRGIETITYVLAGSVEHGDSLGNKGKMTAGDVQWMTAGSGILHQEMPKGDKQGRMHGFQLWANLPASLKMTDPRYQDIPASAIPEVTDDARTQLRIICA